MIIPDIVLVAPITDISGVAESARNLYLALLDLGVKVKLVEIPFWSHLKAKLHPEIEDKIRMGFERNDLRNPAVIHLYPPHAVQGTPTIEGAAFNVSFTVFETDKCPIVWRDALNNNFFVENWVAGKFNVDAYASVGVDKKKLRVINHGVDSARFNPNVEKLKIDGQEGFTLMTAFDWSHRKNPEAMITAFLQEFNNVKDACFVVKSYTGYGNEESKNKIRESITKLRQMTRSNAKILLITDFMHSDSMAGLHASADAWVSLSRGEGWDMGATQSMATAVPVIATNNTAHMEYMDENNSYLVKSVKTPITNKDFLVRNPQFIDHSWYECDIKDAKRQMRAAYEDWKTGAIKEKGKNARAKMLDLSWRKTAVNVVFNLGKYYR